jgi:hypothetical protein
MADRNTTRKSSPLLIAAAWAIVILPTAWGLNYTLRNAMKIFTAKTPATAPSTPSIPAH